MQWNARPSCPTCGKKWGFTSSGSRTYYECKNCHTPLRLRCSDCNQLRKLHQCSNCGSRKAPYLDTPT